MLLEKGGKGERDCNVREPLTKLGAVSGKQQFDHLLSFNAVGEQRKDIKLFVSAKCRFFTKGHNI